MKRNKLIVTLERRLSICPASGNIHVFPVIPGSMWISFLEVLIRCLTNNFRMFERLMNEAHFCVGTRFFNIIGRQKQQKYLLEILRCMFRFWNTYFTFVIHIYFESAKVFKHLTTWIVLETCSTFWRLSDTASDAWVQNIHHFLSIFISFWYLITSFFEGQHQRG